MKRQLLGCVLVILLVVATFYLLGLIIPWFIECGSPRILPYGQSADIEESKGKNVFMWEYEPTEVQYKGASIKIKSAFLEHHHYYSNDTLMLIKEASELQIMFDDYSSLKLYGYKNTWFIDDFVNLAEKGKATKDFYKGMIPADTLTLYIRECYPSMDGLGINLSYYPLSHINVKWDTVQTINLIRKD